jgi:hypothetical protein
MLVAVLGERPERRENDRAVEVALRRPEGRFILRRGSR